MTRGWVVAALVAAIVLLAAAASAVLLVDPGEDVATTPAPTRTPADAPTPAAAPSPTPSPTPTLEPLEGPRPEGVDEIAQQVSDLRGLPLRERIDARVVPQPALGARFAELAAEDLAPEDIAADERLLAALRLIDPDVDLLAVLDAFFTGQVVGMYSTREQILYVGADGPALSPAQQSTAAHEILHALQDQSFGLRERLDLDDEHSDRALATLALVEGDAVLVQGAWAARHQSDREREEARLETLGGDFSALREAPRYIRETLLFPYRAGPRFVQALVEHGGFPAVDEAFARLPTSTAEILDPQRYLDGWTPETVTVTADPGGGWEMTSTYEFGAFDARELFRPVDGEAAAIAEGWSGGRVRLWTEADDDAVALVLRFEDVRTAGRACDATPAWYEAVADGSPAGEGLLEGDRDWMAWTCDRHEVRVGLGPDERTARALASR